MAEHDARNSVDDLNETVSTLYAVYLRLGALCFALALLLAGAIVTVPGERADD